MIIEYLKAIEKLNLSKEQKGYYTYQIEKAKKIKCRPTLFIRNKNKIAEFVLHYKEN
jgi:hypothetical protein